MSRPRADGRVPVMLPFRDGPRGKARRVKRWALPGEFVYNFGWPGKKHDGSEYEGFPCVALESPRAETHGAFFSHGDQIAPQFIPYRCVRPLDDAARETLAALKAAGRLKASTDVTTITVNDPIVTVGDTLRFGGCDYKVVAVNGNELDVRPA